MGRLNTNVYLFEQWCTGEKEFYDMVSDPVQMTNRFANQGTAKTYYGRPEAQLYNRLDALLMVSKSCKQDQCRNPWAVLFPGGQVTSLSGAMLKKYDKFFANQPKVSYNSCE